MRIVTIEEHFLSSGFKEVIRSQGGGLNPALVARLADLGEQRLQDMDAAGIDVQVISHTTSGITALSAQESRRLILEANDQLAEAINTHPDRFAGFAALPMSEPEAAVSELERAVRSLGLKGAMINGTASGRFLDDPAFLPVLEQAIELNVPIYIHPAAPPEAVRAAYFTGFDPAVSYCLATSGWGWHSEVAIHALRLILAGVFDRLPDLQIVIGHMGEMLPFMLDRVDKTLTPLAKNLQLRVPEYFLRNFFITTSGFFSNPPFALALQTIGVEHILFSVDYPYSTNEEGRAFLDHLPLSPEDKEKISHRNAEQLLKLNI